LDTCLTRFHLGSAKLSTDKKQGPPRNKLTTTIFECGTNDPFVTALVVIACLSYLNP
jgi:hypothetical protein